MKGQDQKPKQLTLGDVAYVYQGVGTRDLKLGQEPGEGFVACWAVGASAIDATSSKMNRSHYVRAAIAKRLVDNPLRGSGQMAKLQGQEILIANRGNYKVSNLVGLHDSLEWHHEYLPVYPAATVLVVRAKEKYEWPWRLLAFLDSPYVREKLLRTASGADGDGRVITKADLERLELPPNYLNLGKEFHSKTRENLERLEVLDSRLSALRRAEIQTKAWRELHAPHLNSAYPTLSDEASEAIPGLSDTRLRLVEAHMAYGRRDMALRGETKAQLLQRIDDPILETLGAEVARLEEQEKVICLEFIRGLLEALREHTPFTPSQKKFAEAFKKAHRLELTPEAMHSDDSIGRILAEPIDTLFVLEGQSSAVRMTRGVMELVGAVTQKFKSLVVLNPGAGHLPHMIARRGGPLVSVVPTMSYGTVLLPFAKAYGQSASGRAVFAYETLEKFTKAADRSEDYQGKRNAVIVDVGTTGSMPRMFKEALDKASKAIAEDGVCLAFVAADHFARIKPMLDKVISLTVLPPLPANLKASRSTLAQAFLVEFALNKTQPRSVISIFDATRIVPLEKAGRDLSSEDIAAISRAINDDTDADGIKRYTIKRTDFTRLEEWPGLFALLGLNYDALLAATPETIHDERRRLDHEKKVLEDRLAKEGEVGFVFSNHQVSRANEADLD